MADTIIALTECSIQNGKYENEFEEIEKIEEANYEELFKVRNKTNNHVSAIKKIYLRSENEEKLKKQLKILSIIKNVGGQRVVQYFSAWLENRLIEENGIRTYDNNHVLYIQLQLCDNTLSDIIKEIHCYFYSKDSRALTYIGFFIASQLFTEILKGVNCLHKQNPPLIHRNLNPGNINVKTDIRGNSVKIGEFGSAAIHEYPDQSHTSGIGRPTYIAPEVIKGRKYDTKADIYSLGVIFQELFSIDINRDYTDYNKYWIIVDDYSKNELSLLMTKYKNISDLLERMMRMRYKDRLDCEEILGDKSLWTLSAEEFNFEEELERIGSLKEEMKRSYIYPLIIFKRIEEMMLQFNEDYVRNGFYETRFEVIEQLNEKSFGELLKVKDKIDNNFYTIRKIKFKTESGYIFLKKLRTSFTINKLNNNFEVWLEDENSQSNYEITIYIQMPFFDKTLKDIIEEINEYLCSKNKSLSLIGYYIATQLFIETLKSIDHLHKLNPPAIHTGLNSYNMLMKTEIRGNSIKLSDIDSVEDYQSKEKQGKYDIKVDIMSLGIILNELLNIDIVRNTADNDFVSPDLSSKYSHAIGLCDRMRSKTPNDRPSCEEILKESHLWGLDAREFEFKKNFKEIVKSRANFGKSFVYQLIIYKWIIGLAPLFEENHIRKDWYKRRFNEGLRLGGGSFGEVFEVKNKCDDKFFAVKKIKMQSSYEYEFMYELENCPNITRLNDERFVKYYDLWLEETPTEKTPLLYIQMEKCDTTLKDIIKEIEEIHSFRGKDCLTLLGYHIVIQIFIEILEAVNNLHKLEQQIIHRDLNPVNIMLKITPNCRSFIKITDFGSACIHKHAKHTADRGNIVYMAPEVYGEDYDTRADIYSLGVVMEKDLFKIKLNMENAESEDQPPLLISKYRIIEDLCDRMTQRKPKNRPENIDKILSDKDSWLLNENEFDAQNEFENISNLNDTSFVYKLLRHLLP